MHQREDIAPSWRAINALLGTLLVVSLGGCTLAGDTHRVFFLAKRTTKVEPKYFPYLRNEKLTRYKNRSLAKRVWHEVTAADPHLHASVDYADGFIDGFADYLYRGGSGEPPVVPPRRYWNLPFKSPRGQFAVNDWYSGFCHGSEECKTRGLRDLVVVPSSLWTHGGIVPAAATMPIPTDALPVQTFSGDHPPYEIPEQSFEVPLEALPPSTWEGSSTDHASRSRGLAQAKFPASNHDGPASQEQLASQEKMASSKSRTDEMPRVVVDAGSEGASPSEDAAKPEMPRRTRAGSQKVDQPGVEH